MFGALFRGLENRCDPFPPQLPSRPPESLGGFIWHYARPFTPLLIAVALLSMLGAAVEVWLFAFVGNLVDWLASSARETFWRDHRLQLIGMAAVALLLLPFLTFCHTTILHQGLLATCRCARDGRRTAICCARAWNFFTTTSPGASPPR